MELRWSCGRTMRRMPNLTRDQLRELNKIYLALSANIGVMERLATVLEQLLLNEEETERPPKRPRKRTN